MSFGLSPRLNEIVSLVPQGSFVADVGSDHGAVPIALLQRGLAKGVQAIENKEGPFRRLSEAVDNNLEDKSKIYLSLSDGISKLLPEVDTVVLAGLGGQLIARILLSHPEKLEHVNVLIFDAHREKEDALLAAATLGFEVVEERFLLDGSIPYFLQKLERADHPVRYREDQLLFGPKLVESKPEEWKQYVRMEKERVERLLGLSLSPDRRTELLHYQRIMEDLLNEH